MNCRRFPSLAHTSLAQPQAYHRPITTGLAQAYQTGQYLTCTTSVRALVMVSAWPEARALTDTALRCITLNLSLSVPVTVSSGCGKVRAVSS